MSQKVHDAAGELNVNARFGRWDVATEHVDSTASEAFQKRHESWGGFVRVLEAELAHVRPKGDKEAELVVRYSWFRPDHQDLKSTDVKQTWKQTKLGWKLFTEEVASGDEGLFTPRSSDGGGPVRSVDNDQSSRYRTVRIGGASPSPASP